MARRFAKKYMDGELYDHPSHPEHQLRFHINVPESTYVCNGCELPIYSRCFKCPYEECPFYLHKMCYKADESNPELRKESLAGLCEFKFYKDIPSKISDHSGDFLYCDACGQDIKGFRYRCIPDAVRPHDPHDLHPTCFHSGTTMELKSGMKLELKPDMKSKCLGCEKRYAIECIRFTGWKWVSEKRKYWGFPYCFTGARVCFHLKCMNTDEMKKLLS